MDDQDEKILKALVSATSIYGTGLSENELRSDRAAHENMKSDGFEFPEEWSFGGGSAAAHLKHLADIDLIVKKRMPARGRIRTVFEPTFGVDYTRELLNQQVIPTKALWSCGIHRVSLSCLWGDIIHSVGTPTISEGPMKPGAISTIGEEFHRFSVRGPAALYGSPRAFWKFSAVVPS